MKTTFENFTDWVASEDGMNTISCVGVIVCIIALVGAILLTMGF
jgi:hypothetical protein